jgi:DNA-binding transcriptional LysR family regulator
VLIRQLEYVVAVAREGHFGRAAASCWVSQPTLSDGISRLESELGVIIIRRGRRYEGLTPEGERLVSWARRLLTERDELVAELSTGRRTLSGRLRIGAIPTALPPIPLVTEAFCHHHPNVGIEVDSLPSNEILRRLSAFELDAGLTYLDEDTASADVMSIPLYREHYLVVTPTRGPLSAHEEVSWAEVAELPLCLLSQDMQNRRILDARFEQDGVAATPRIETDSLSVLSGHLCTGHWTSVVPQSWLHLFGVPDQTRLVRLAGPPVSATVGLVVLAREPMPALVQALLDTVTKLNLQQALDVTAGAAAMAASAS